MKKQSGVSLVELMIVVAILGIIVSISVPYLKTYKVRTARGADCKVPLAEMAIALEKYHDRNGVYTTTIGDINFSQYSATDASDSKYEYEIAAGTTGNINSSYVISCKKVAANNLDTDCGTLTLDNFGRKGMTDAVTGSTRSAEDCWR